MSCAYSGCSCLGGGPGLVECSSEGGKGSSCSFNGECAGEDTLMSVEESHHHPHQQSSSEKGSVSSSSSGGGREDCGSPPSCSGCQHGHHDGEEENGDDGSINCCSGSGTAATPSSTTTYKSSSLTTAADSPGSPPNSSTSTITSSSSFNTTTSSSNTTASTKQLIKMSCEQQQDSTNNNNVRTKPVLKFSVSAILGADDHHHKMKRAVIESTPVFNASKIGNTFSIHLYLYPYENDCHTYNMMIPATFIDLSFHLHYFGIYSFPICRYFELKNVLSLSGNLSFCRFL